MAEDAGEDEFLGKRGGEGGEDAGFCAGDFFYVGGEGFGGDVRTVSGFCGAT